MSSPIFIDGKEYISAHKASEFSNLTRDYITKLLRDKKISGTHIGSKWFVEKKSLDSFLVELVRTKESRRIELQKAREREYASHRKHHTPQSTSEAHIVPALSVRTPGEYMIRTRFLREKYAHQLGAVPSGIGHAAYQSLPHAPIHHVHAVGEWVHKATAFFLALAITFSSFSFITNQNYKDVITSALYETAQIAESVVTSPGTDSTTQVAAATQSSFLSDLWSRFFLSGNSASGARVSVDIQPYQPTRAVQGVAGQATSSVVIREKTIIIQKNTPIVALPSSRSSESVFFEKLQELDNRLSSKIAYLTATAPRQSEIVTPYVLAQATRIDSLTNTTLQNPTIQGGTIQNVSLSNIAINGSTFSGFLAVVNGGTGTSTAPQYGDLLVGDGAGGYQLLATSSLGILGGSGSPGGANTNVQFNNLGTFGGSGSFTFNSLLNRLTVTNASTTALSSSYASSTQGFFGTLSIGSLNGILKATGGVISSSLISLASDVTGVLSISNGGTGTSTPPTYGKILVGNAGGTYDLVSTSSLGISGGGGGGTWGSITGTLSSQTDLQNALDAKLSLSAWYATTTDALLEGISNKYFTNARFDARFATDFAATTTTALAEGTNLYFTTARADTNFANNLAGTTTSALTEGSNLYFTTARATTSFVGNLAATTSINSITTLNNLSLSATQLTNYGLPFYQFFSATTTDALLEGTNNKYYTDTRVNTYVNSSTTIPKTYTANTFTELQTFQNASTTNISASYASSTSVFFGNLSIANLSGFLKATAGSVSTALISLTSDVT
ncbi:hypothetical protein EBR66_00875, partial [bacterium]|nr:hypothetical protein [bacterium]